MEHIVLNLPPAQFKVKNTENGRLIWDVIRKKYLVLTPEEWVRQHMVHFLANHLNVPLNQILVERGVQTAQLHSRFDIAIVTSKGACMAVVECKASTVTLNQDTVQQLMRYADELHPRWLIVTNGLKHLIFTWDSTQSSYVQQSYFPENLTDR